MPNGRPAATIDVHFQPGAPDTITLQMTWGLATTHDGGASWYWSCEEAVGFGGDYDPDYEYTASGLLLATTTSFDGLRMTRDLCDWAPAPLPLGPTDRNTPGKHVAQIEVGSDGTIYAAVSTATDMQLYVSVDDGVSFAPRSLPEAGVDAWISLEVAPSQAGRLYLTGHRFVVDHREWVLLRSDDAGMTWTPLSAAPFTIGDPDGELQIATIAPNDPDLVFARVFQVSGVSIGDDVYRSDDGGDTWTRVFQSGDHVSAVVVRESGEVVLATRTSGVHVSSDGGQTFGEPVAATLINCMTERDGLLWGCGRSFAPDLMALGTSKDAVGWEMVTRFDLYCAPVACEPGTGQRDICADERWEGVSEQYSIDGSGCPAVVPDEPGMPEPPPPKETCCGASDPGTAALLAMVVVLGIRKRRVKPIR
jgi:hypothetical protein